MASSCISVRELFIDRKSALIGLLYPVPASLLLRNLSKEINGGVVKVSLVLGAGTPGKSLVAAFCSLPDLKF